MTFPKFRSDFWAIIWQNRSQRSVKLNHKGLGSQADYVVERNVTIGEDVGFVGRS